MRIRRRKHEAGESWDMAKKILVADDEMHIVRILRDTLVKRGYEVVTAADGQEAVDMALAETPDLIFLDVMMPRLSGLEVCHKLRGEHGVRVPVFLLTARGQERDISLGEEAGADK